MHNLGNQFLFDMDKAKCNSAAILKGKTYRISILTERLIRIEYNPQGLFIDTPTQLVLCRNFTIPRFNVNQDNNFMEVSTKYFKLTYAKESRISSGNLKVYITGSENIWYYRHPEVRTYDALVADINDSKSIKGIYSKDGFASIDDSKSLLIDSSGNFVKRPNEGIDLYLFVYGDDFKLALNDYYSLTGRPLLIPRYALGNWWSKNYLYDDKTLDKLFNRFKKEEIPISTLLFDTPWHILNPKFKTGYSFNKKLLPDPKEFINNMHKRGVKVGVSIDPSGGIFSYEEMYKKVLEYVKIDNNKTIAFAPFNPSFIDIFLKILLHSIENNGVDYFWLDYKSSDKYSNYIINHYMYLDSGRSESKRNMLLSNNPMIAAHRYGPICLSGATVGFDALKKIPYINSSAANIGVSWISEDIGGYTGGREDSELYLRYVELGCFSPIFRIHVDGGRYYKREPWRWNIDTSEIVKYYMQLRHRLVPYIYSFAYKYYNEGTPLITPLYYNNKEMFYDLLYRNEYFFGSELLVSPLTDKKDIVMNRVVHKLFLPEGLWYDFKTGKKFPGGRSYVSFFKDEDYPVFAKSGAIIPMDININNDLSLPTDLEIQIFPGCSNSFTLYEDDGITNLYKNGHYLKTLIDYNYQASNYTISIKSIDGKSGIVPRKRNYKIRLRNTLKTNDMKVKFKNSNITFNSYEDENDFIIEIKDVDTIGELFITCKGKAIEIDAVRLVNEDIDGIISEIDVDTFMKDKIANILYSNLTIKKKRIQIRKLKKDKLDIKFIKMFLRLLEYIEQI